MNESERRHSNRRPDSVGSILKIEDNLNHLKNEKHHAIASRKNDFDLNIAFRSARSQGPALMYGTVPVTRRDSLTRPEDPAAAGLRNQPISNYHPTPPGPPLVPDTEVKVPEALRE